MSDVLTSEEIDELEALESKKAVVDTSRLDPGRLMKDTEINPVDLDTAMIKQAGLFSHYSIVAANTNERAEKLKLRRDVLESKIDEEIRRAALSEGSKMTEKMIEAAVHRDTRWIKAQSDLITARTEADLARSALEALRHKRDMMVQLGVNQREEMKGDLRLREIEINNSKPATGDGRARALAVAGQSKA